MIWKFTVMNSDITHLCKAYFPLGELVRANTQKSRNASYLFAANFYKSRCRILVFASRRANKGVKWKIGFSQRLCRNMVLYRHVFTVFLPNLQIAIPKYNRSWMANIPKTLLLVGWARIQLARDDEGPYFCINQNKNIDNDFYCNSNEFPNHLTY